MRRQRPDSLTNAIRTVVSLVLLTGLGAVLTAVFRDRLVRSWAEGHRTAREMLAEGGIGAFDGSSVTPPAFVPVAIVLFIVFAALTGVLVVFLIEGHNWARLSLSALVLFLGFGTLAGMQSGPPLLFVVLAWISLVLDAVLLFFLWRRDTSAYMHGSWLGAQPDSSRSAPGPS